LTFQERLKNSTTRYVSTHKKKFCIILQADIKMKVSVPKDFPRARETAALPLIPGLQDDTGRAKMSFKLYTDPANEASPKVTVTMFVLTGGESLHEHLVWRENLEKVMRGLNLDTPTKKDNTISQLVVGAASTSYQKGLKDSLETLWTAQREEAAQAVRGNNREV
jgi:hypothetical protein